MKKWIIKLEEWVFKDSDCTFCGFFKLSFVISAFLILLCVPIYILVAKAEKTEYERCLNSGKGWAIVGSHYQYNLVGKIPVYTKVVDYGCVEIVKR